MKIRSGGLLAVAMAVPALVACTHTPVGYRVPGEGEQRVVVVTERDAVKTGQPAWSLAMPLGEEEDASVLKLLAQAEASGAKYLSDVDVVYAAEDNGQRLECRTHYLPVVAVESKTLQRPHFPMRAPMHVHVPQVTVASSPGEVATTTVGETRTQPYVRLPAHLSDIPHYDEQLMVKRWRLLRTEPECKPLAQVVERVESRAYGCGASACEDKTL
ncbi:hypothetical protein [Archangium lipolyticum]|uniref:hypothetical protein n=1 Tax=Archangium lipolyticum TaxID=2970465 RepID=UPI00214A34D4|nr:hypothetical protein [Archangium lipolyticum]